MCNFVLKGCYDPILPTGLVFDVVAGHAQLSSERVKGKLEESKGKQRNAGGTQRKAKWGNDRAIQG